MDFAEPASIRERLARNKLATGIEWCYTGVLYARPQERSRHGAAPKEQPPRKLSGKRTAGARALWKEAGDLPLTEGVSPPAFG
jgi:hypothetical protein